MEVNELVGSWSLQAFEIQDTQGNLRSWGSNVTGLLIYSSDGRMSVSINADPSGDPPSPTQLLAAMLFYSGTFEIRDGHIVHLVTNASDRSRIGNEMVRSAELKSELLTIKAAGDYGSSRLVWRRNETV